MLRGARDWERRQVTRWKKTDEPQLPTRPKDKPAHTSGLPHNKVESQTRSALSQFATEPDRARVLVFNINSPSGAIWSDFLNAAAERVASLSNGSIRCEFLLQGHRLAPDNI